MKNAAKFDLNNKGLPANLEDWMSKINQALDPFSAERARIGNIPFYSSGARALIRAAGKPIGVAQNISWRISYVSTPINTIDSPFPWDIDVGSMVMNASIQSIIDPTAGPEASGMFHTMSSVLHAPQIELQILDKSGTSILFARGMFLEISGSVQFGQLSSWNARFVGSAYQHYVGQNFKPYNSIQAGAGKLLGGLKDLASNLTGGIL